MTKTYQVVKGIFKGHIFEGHEITISNLNGTETTRVYDHDTLGRSYYLSDCIVLG